MTVLGLATAVVLPSVRAYARQEQQLAELHAKATAAAEEVDNLAAEVARWGDVAYVIAQARERLAFILPGETPYRVIDSHGTSADEPTPGASTGGE